MVEHQYEGSLIRSTCTYAAWGDSRFRAVQSSVARGHDIKTHVSSGSAVSCRVSKTRKVVYTVIKGVGFRSLLVQFDEATTSNYLGGCPTGINVLCTSSFFCRGFYLLKLKRRNQGTLGAVLGND